MLAAIGAFCIGRWTSLFDPLLVNDDVRQQLFWMARFFVPALYPDDPLSAYSIRYVSLGIHGLYRLASPFLHPLLFSNLLTGILYVWAAGLLAGIAGRICGRRFYYAVAFVYLLTPMFMTNLSGGLARCFAAPLTVFFLWARVNESRRFIAAALLLQALFIPYIFVFCITALGVEFLADRLRGNKSLFPGGFADWTAALVAGGIVLGFNLAFDAAGFGPLVGSDDIADRPEFRAGGRLEIVPTPSLWWEVIVMPFERTFPFLEWGPIAGYGIAGAATLLSLWGLSSRPWTRLAVPKKPLYAALAASLILYVAARLVLLKLFLPARYVEHIAHVLLCLGMGVAVMGVVDRLRIKGRTLGVAALIAAALVGGLRLEGVALEDYRSRSDLFQAVRQTPKNALYMGHPFTLDNVLTFGERRVYASFELAHPWAKGWWNFFGPRLEGMLDAYYGADGDAIIRFAAQNRITHLVVEDVHFSDSFLTGKDFFVSFHEKPWCPALVRDACLRWGYDYKVEAVLPDESPWPVKPPFFAPFDRPIKDRAAAGVSFALMTDPRFRGQTVLPGVRIVDLRPLYGS